MVDREARDVLAEQLRHLVAGLTTNYQFEDRLRRSADAAVREISLEIWAFYDDMHEHKLTDAYDVSSADRELMIRCMLFLKTDEPWRWPRRRLIFLIGVLMPPVMLMLFSLGFWSALLLIPAYIAAAAVYQRWYVRRGEESVWPFFSAAELERARAQTVYLGGAAA